MKKFIFTLLTVSAITLIGCESDRYDRSTHDSMSSCWYYVQSHIGSRYTVYTDTSTEIRGAFGAKPDKGFSCVVKDTGTQGSYVESSISNATRP